MMESHPCCLQIEDVLGLAKSMLGDLSGYERFHTDAQDLHAELQNWRREQFDDWCREMQSQIDDRNNPLRLEIVCRFVSND